MESSDDVEETKAEYFFFEFVWPSLKYYVLAWVLIYLNILPDNLRGHWILLFVVIVVIYSFAKYFLNQTVASE